MNNVEISDLFANMWAQSRVDAGKSQEYMAKSLGVSRQTIQNWEKGLAVPNQKTALLWFQALELQPIPYYLRILYPSMRNISPKSDDQAIEDALIDCVKNACTPDQKRKLLYLFLGKHGSSPSGVIELMTAHLHTPLRDRMTIANTVLASYDVAESLGELVEPQHVKPNISLLKKCLLNSIAAIKDNKNSYITLKE